MMMIPDTKRFGLDLFDDMFADPFFSRTARTDSMMKTDVQETEGGYLMDMELPGFSKEDVKAELKEGYMTISAEKNSSSDQKDDAGNYIRRERYSGSCSRSFFVGETITEDDIKASFRDGILHLEIPKEDPQKLEPQTRSIMIEG